MILVTLADEYGELGRIEIEKIEDFPDDSADYAARFAVERAGAVGLHRRPIYRFPRTHTNILGLLLAALNTLTEEELTLEDGTSASDLSRADRGSVARRPLGWRGLYRSRLPEERSE